MFIDFHMHIYPTSADGIRAKGDYEIWEYGVGHHSVRYASDAGTLEEAAAEMRASGCERAVVANLVDPSSVTDVRQAVIDFNAWVFARTSKRDDFVPFAAIDLRSMAARLAIEYLDEVRQQHRLRGVKIHPVTQRLDLADPDVASFFAYCVDHQLIVLSHSGPSRSGRFSAEPNDFRPVLRRHPRLRLVLAHLGGASWSQALALAQEYPSLLFDCSEIIHWLDAPNAPQRRDFTALLRSIGVERVMLGSDYPWYSLRDTYGLLSTLPTLKPDEVDAIAYANAAQLLEG